MAITDQNIIRLLTGTAAQHPGRIVFIEGERRITFGHLLQQVQQKATFFLNSGLKSGDAVLVFVPVSIDLYRTVLALLYAGIVPVFLDEWGSLARVKQCCAVVRPKALVAPRKLLWLASILKPFRDIPLKLSPTSPPPATYRLNEQEIKTGDEAALITFTTGTTGLPKAAVRTHAILHAQFNALTPLLQPDASVSLTLLPVVVLLNIGLGKTTVLSSVNPKNYKAGDAAKLLEIMQRAYVTSLIASPFIVIELAKYCKSKRVKTGIAEVITGGGPVFPGEAALLAETFGDALTTVVYGSTEAEPISHIRVAELAGSNAIARTGLPVGRVAAAATVVIVPFHTSAYAPLTTVQWQQLQVPPGRAGEILVSGAHVVRHYIANKDEEQRQKIYVEDAVWHRTGDAGAMDESGRLFLYGRCNQVVAHNGIMIYPFLIEHAVKEVAGVQDAAFFKKGAVPILAVVLTGGVQPDTLHTWLQQSGLQGLTVRTLKALPKDRRHRTKIDYNRLNDLV